MATWTSEGGWNSEALCALPEHWHRMSARERRAELGHDFKPAHPPVEMSADGGYKIPDEFVDAFRALVGM